MGGEKFSRGVFPPWLQACLWPRKNWHHIIVWIRSSNVQLGDLLAEKQAINPRSYTTKI